MFVMKTDIDRDNMGPVPTEAGKFTADTTLMAKFGDDTMTADDFTISGTVENFVLTNYDGTPVGNEWSLTLNSAAFASRMYNSTTAWLTASQTTGTPSAGPPPVWGYSWQVGRRVLRPECCG